MRRKCGKLCDRVTHRSNMQQRAVRSLHARIHNYYICHKFSRRSYHNTIYDIYPPTRWGSSFSIHRKHPCSSVGFVDTGRFLFSHHRSISFPWSGPPGLLSVVNSLIFTITFILLWDYTRNVCLATLKIRAVLVMDSCLAFMQIGGLLLLANLGFLSAAHAYWAIGIASGIATLSLLISLRREFAVRFTQAMSDFKVNFSTGWWIFGSGMLWTFKTSLYPWLLAGFHGTLSTGVWAACVGVVALCNPLLLGLQNSIGPKIAHAYTLEEMEGFRRFSLQTATLFGGLIAPFCVVFLLFGGSLVAGIYGSKYTGNGFIVSILALNLLISAPAVPLARALFTIGRADIDFKINLITLLCTLSFGIFLVKAYGIIGAAYGLLISNIVCFVFKYISIRRLDYSNKGKYLLESERLVNKTIGIE